jgi:hypothetical protein
VSDDPGQPQEAINVTVDPNLPAGSGLVPTVSDTTPVDPAGFGVSLTAEGAEELARALLERAAVARSLAS